MNILEAKWEKKWEELNAEREELWKKWNDALSFNYSLSRSLDKNLALLDEVQRLLEEQKEMQKTMHLCYSKGYIRYEGSTTDPCKVIVEVDPEISRLARALIPKYAEFNYPKYPPHISVVRKEIPPNMVMWAKYADEVIGFAYNPEVQWDDTYYWLQVFCPKLSELRVELGLPPSRAGVTLSPNGDSVFHITVGNKK